MNTLLIAEILVSFVVAVTWHEWAHALMATALGDPTPRARGRLSLTPRRHLSSIGTLLAVILSFFVAAGIGWGRPVELDVRRMRVGPNLGTALVALAGPAANLLLGVGIALGLAQVPGSAALAPQTLACASNGGLIGGALERCLGVVQPAYALRLEQLAFVFAVTNLVLAVANLIPLHPLDGYAVVFAVLPTPQAISWRNAAPYMELSLVLIFFLVPYFLRQFGIALFDPGAWVSAIATSVANALSGGRFAFFQVL